MADAKTGTGFELTHTKDGEKNILTISPTVKNEGYPEKSIEITQEQWDTLQYHFAKMVNDKLKISKLAYVY